MRVYQLEHGTFHDDAGGWWWRTRIGSDGEVGMGMFFPFHSFRLCRS